MFMMMLKILQLPLHPPVHTRAGELPDLDFKWLPISSSTSQMGLFKSLALLVLSASFTQPTLGQETPESFEALAPTIVWCLSSVSVLFTFEHSSVILIFFLNPSYYVWCRVDLKM